MPPSTVERSLVSGNAQYSSNTHRLDLLQRIPLLCNITLLYITHTRILVFSKGGGLPILTNLSFVLLWPRHTTGTSRPSRGWWETDIV